jgi:hypothetical protein
MDLSAGERVAPGIRGALKDKWHLVTLGLLSGLALAGFVAAQQLLVPRGFGRYGPFRPGALDDNRQRALHFAGRERCVACHDEQASQLPQGAHAKVACEACHGPLAAHAEDPSSVPAHKPSGRAFCLGCHAQGAAKPQTFPQVEAHDHGEDAPCVSCHPPHRPGDIKGE